MTISLERPALKLADRSMVEPYSIVDPYDEPHTVVTIRVKLTRDQLAAVVERGIQYYGDERHPDLWTAVETRVFAEMNIAAMDELEIQQLGESIVGVAAPDYPFPDERERVLAVYRAVDRAFPKTLE